MIKNAYVHIPFCKSKCHYCSFVSSDDLSAKKAYLHALESQIKAEYLLIHDGGLVNPPYGNDMVADSGQLPRPNSYSNFDILPRPNGERTEVRGSVAGDRVRMRAQNKLNTLYFGGGTPSLLTIDEFKTLINLFEFEDDAEITVEVNPDSVDFEYLSALRALGVNRLSIGIQTFDDKILKLIGRRHNAKQALDAVGAARRAAFENISVDFIYGLPSQTIEGFEADLKKACELNIQHVSLYGLKIEENSVFGRNLPKNIADADAQADMYLKTIEILTQNGFEHYEISNFSRAGYNSRHNLNYWNANTYYGFGCAASGYGCVGLASPTYMLPRPLRERAGVRGLRYTNETNLEKYIKNPTSKISQEELFDQDALEEAIFLGFRKIAGIDTSKINTKFNIDFEEKYAKILEKYTDFFVKTQQGWALNTNGILISNEILSEFIE